MIEVKERRITQPVTITPTTGKRDIYFVFKNEKALSSQIIMQLSGIEFKMQ